MQLELIRQSRLLTRRLRINDDRRCRSRKDRRCFGRIASPASKAFIKSRPRRLRHLMSLVLPGLPNWSASATVWGLSKTCRDTGTALLAVEAVPASVHAN